MKFLYGIILIALFLTVMIATHSEARCPNCFTTNPNAEADCKKCCGNRWGKCAGYQCVCPMK
uniref:U14-hottentoxin-Hj1a n=1 Tax=Hottentotta judaicus TaxID=6863 RepID=F1CIY7_HOTJU|nr:U14-hottentoxin-Hj1a [Hottentotta judaicus]